MFSSNYDLEQEVYRFTRNECNKEIMYAILKKLKTTNEQIEYALYVNLPKMLRNTNITPYSILDCTKYASVYQFLFDQLTQLFGMNIPELIVTGIELIEDNDTKIQDLKQEIEDIQSFDVSDTMEEATKLDRLATNRMYELMVSFNGNSNSTKRKLGNLVLNKNGLDRISATALSRLCAIPAYADFFKPSYKEIIAEAMKSDAQKTYERNSQPVIEEKNRAIGKTYMSNFLLRKALSMANTAVSSDEVASNE